MELGWEGKYGSEARHMNNLKGRRVKRGNEISQS